jgi:hypothetical protein
MRGEAALQAQGKPWTYPEPIVEFGFRRSDAGGLVPHEAEQEAIRERFVTGAGKYT